LRSDVEVWEWYWDVEDWGWVKVNACARRIYVEVGEGDVGDWGWGKENAVGIAWGRWGNDGEVGEGDVGDCWGWEKVNAWGKV